MLLSLVLTASLGTTVLTASVQAWLILEPRPVFDLALAMVVPVLEPHPPALPLYPKRDSGRSVSVCSFAGLHFILSPDLESRMFPRMDSRLMTSSGTILRLWRSGPVTRSSSTALRHTRMALPKEQDANTREVPDLWVIAYRTVVALQAFDQPNQVEKVGNESRRDETVKTTCQEHTQTQLLIALKNSKRKPLGERRFLIVLWIGWHLLDCRFEERNE